PDEIAITIMAVSGWLRFKAGNTGDNIPAAVIIATVAEPWVTLTSAARAHARNTTGIDDPAIDSASMTPIPLSTSICLRTPPAPVTNIIIPAGPRAFVLRSRMV